MTKTERALFEYVQGIKAAHEDPPVGLPREEWRAWSDDVDRRYIDGTAAIDALSPYEPEAAEAKAFCRAIEARTAYGWQNGIFDEQLDSLIPAMSERLGKIATQIREMTEAPLTAARVIGESPSAMMARA
jgi:hypothetical protein